MLEACDGEHENYAQFSQLTERKGQLIPIQDVQPLIKKVGEIQITTEVKVEMMCHNEIINNVVTSMKKKTHQ